jgi:hypothetical protein
LPHHSYPRREQDLVTLKRFHDNYGMAPQGFVSQLLSWVRGGGGLT